MFAAIIYSHSTSPRLQYIVDFLSAYFNQPIKLENDEDRYVKSGFSCKINYSYHRLGAGEIWIHPYALLFESIVHPVKIECFETKCFKAFFKTEGDVGFDLFAAIFFLISRYEEYLPHTLDAYGRYAHENSVAYKEGFLNQPLVNIWLEHFRTLLTEKKSLFASSVTSFSFQPTYDIDMAWSYLNKGWMRNAGASAKLLATGQWRLIKERIRVLRSRRDDPFDAYAWMDELHNQYDLRPIYFFLVAQQKGRYDRNVAVDNDEFIQLVEKTASNYSVALHPSWASGDQPNLIEQEKRILEQMVHNQVTSSRQHYIRFQLPDTYKHLIQAGITDDYSMGYGSINGFRASIASSFFWYDLKSEQATQLLLHPFCFMDANAYYEQHFTPAQAFGELMELHEKVKSVNGRLVTIWHNSFLGTASEFSGWHEVYQKFIDTVTK
jgi:hypothetical protein